MIKLSLGNVGSGKTVSVVRDMILETNLKYYSNIITKKTKNNVVINSDMIIKKEIVGQKKKSNGEYENIIEKKLNVEFWKGIKESINIVLDEAHTILNSRRAMSKQNILIGEWIALIRRVLSDDSNGMGDLILITQMHNRVDLIARGMAHQIAYHICHYQKYCSKKGCGFVFNETSESFEQLKLCPHCTKILKKRNHVVEVFKFNNIPNYVMWKESGYKIKSFYDNYLIRDIENYFPYYNTLQWENLISDY